jgi:hypothetical protein
MESVRKARGRLQNYPVLLGRCGTEASAYAKCVAGKLAEVKQFDCQPEFDLFKKCIQTNAKKIGTKI